MASGPTILERLVSFENEMREELLIASRCKPVYKDILIVTHNQQGLLESCIQSIRKNTQHYQIYVWDNGSNEPVRSQPDVIVVRNEINEGFVLPNNRLATMGNNPYIILLNDDTVVYPGWDTALIGYIQETGAAQVGYVGGWLDENAQGFMFGWGSKVDYIPGWCFAVSRRIYEKYGLFDEQFQFAYCEDADFSLRLTAAGEKIHALHLGLVFHYENSTIKTLPESYDCKTTFHDNHSLLKRRWASRLVVSPCATKI